jgi:sialate O-acetylesterase
MTPKPISPLNGLAVLVSGSLHADVKPNPLFTDGAVLQRGQPVPVWGTARDGERVTVEFNKQQGLPASPYRTDVD